MNPEETQSSFAVSLLAWFEVNKRRLMVAVVGLLAVGFGVYVYNYAREQKEQEASAALFALNRPVDSAGKRGPVIAADYLRIAEKFSDTRAGERALLLAADRLFSDGKYPEARARFEAFQSAYPDSEAIVVAALGVAACHDALNEADPAAAGYERVMNQFSTAPEATQAKLALGLLHEAKNRPEQALKLYDEILRARQPTVWRMEADMRRDQLIRKHPQVLASALAALAPVGATNAAAALTQVVAPTNAPTRKP